MPMEQPECSETSAYKIHTPGNYPEENIQQQEGFSLEYCPHLWKHLWKVMTDVHLPSILQRQVIPSSSLVSLVSVKFS